MRQRTIWLAALCVAFTLILLSIGLYLHHLRSLPVTTIDLSGKTSIIGITSWRICGPFAAADRDQRYSPASEQRMFDTDYLESAGGTEASLKLPPGITEVRINFQRDPGEEPSQTTNSSVFLNQTVNFPMPEVSAQLLFWGGYHLFKVVYAAADLESSTDQDVVMLAATNAPVKIWVNGTAQIQSAPGSVGANWYSTAGGRVHLRAGRNAVLVKSIWFPFRNGFSVWVGTPERIHEFIDEHGGVFDVLNRILIPRGVPLSLAPILAIYDESPARDGSYEIRDVSGHTLARGHLATAGHGEIKVEGLRDGLYSISLQKGTLATGELFFVGDLARRLATYSARCATKAAGDLPCEALPKLLQTSNAYAAEFRLDKQKQLLLLLAQFEWALHPISPKLVVSDQAPRVRLISFRSNIDGSLQHYYLYVPADAEPREGVPLVVIMPFNTLDAPFFDNTPTTNPDALQRYARFAGRYHLAYAIPFARGLQMPAALAEADVLEVIQDAKTRVKVDDGRLYLAGECAGGRSAFLMAEDYPDVFSALSTSGPATGESTIVTDSFMDSGNALLRLRNLSSIPIGLTQAEADPHSPESVALLLLQEARKVGIYPKFTVTRGTGTLGLIDATRNMLEFFATIERRGPFPPLHVDLGVTELKHNRAFWLTVDRLQNQSAPGYITCDIVAPNRIMVSSANIRSFTINIHKLPPGLASNKIWAVVCNEGQEQRLTVDQSGGIAVNVAQ